MNHVYVVKSSGIEVIRMNDDLSRMVYIVSKPINADLLFHLHGLKANNLDNPTLKHYYTDVLELDVDITTIITGIGRVDRNVVRYLNVENLSEKWFRDLRLTLAIIANECGEKDIANFTKPSSTVGVIATLSSCHNSSNAPHAIQCHSTFTIVTKLDGEEGISINTGDNSDKTLNNVNVQQGDVFLFTDRYLLEKASLAFRGDVELLSVDVNPSIDIKGQQDMGFEDYLNGGVMPTDYVKTTLNKMDTTPFTYTWTSEKDK